MFNVKLFNKNKMVNKERIKKTKNIHWRFFVSFDFNLNYDGNFLRYIG